MATNSVGPSGITIQALSDIVAEITAGMQAIYGAGINLNPNTPDGQMVNLIAQAKKDVLEMVMSAAASMDPDQATGVLLDQRCAYNAVVREQGTYTQQSVTVTASGSVTLQGLDLYPTAPFTVADGSGNQYQLLVTTTLSAGSTALNFQALVLGAVSSPANSITVPATIVAGVTAVNNPSVPTIVGTNEETDAALRIRRANSVQLPSIGWLAGMYAAIYDVPGVAQVQIFENDTPSTNGAGVPASSIWAIVNGGTDALVAAAIYLKRNAGCGLYGSVSVNITQLDGTVFVIKFDRPIAEALWFEATLTAITGALDKVWIAAQVLAQFGTSYGINQAADSASIVAYIKSIAPNASVSAEGVSTTGSGYSTLVTPTGVNYQFYIPDVSHVTIS